MTFDSPVAFNAALEQLRRKALLPTALSTSDLREMSDRARRLSLYSARTTSLEYLTEMKKVLADTLSGKINDATARQLLQEKLDHLGYSPEKSFGTPADRATPPAEKGSLTDLSSDRRVKLVIQTNSRLASNTAFAVAGGSDVRLFQFPAWEFKRVYPRLVPRGEVMTKEGIEPDPENSWPARWEKAGGELVGGRMIALKGDAIWENLGDTDLFDDGTDADVPPYAFNSGYGIVEVPREECIALGLVTPNRNRNPNPNLKKPNLLAGLFAADADTTKVLTDLAASRSQLLAAAKEAFAA